MLRHLRRWSQVELAKHAGVSRETVSRVERGWRPNLTTAQALVGALGCPLDTIFPVDVEDGDA